MTLPILEAAFNSGELSPSLYGRLDIAKWHSGCSVARNMVVSYKGGLFSRAGTLLCGMSKQPASSSSTPPRIIEFRFNIRQSYILEFGDRFMRVVANGAYVTESAFTGTAISQANPAQATVPGHNYVNGDWIFLTVGGMTELNNQTVIVQNVSGNNFTLTDTFGDPIDSLTFPPFTSGTAARIYTLATPYAAVDLPYLKFTQSADVMSLCLVNQQTAIDYQEQELTRLAANSWTIAPPAIASSIGPPTSPGAVASSAGSVAYGYVVTSVDALTGEESIASAIATVASAVNIAATFGTITVSWTAPATGTVSGYNVYRATADFTNTGSFTGQLFGFAGSTAGATKWTDDNIIPDFNTVPPLNLDPFVGTGNYPGVAAYFQQRRMYAASLDAPDTYQFSQPGAYLNFDARIPPIDSDAITGTPWAQQVNGIQWALNMPGGLVVATGEDCWLLSGTGGASSPITPAQQSAQQQESNGFSPTLPPIKINYQLLFGQALGSGICSLNYNFYSNIYTGEDITVLSSHLFQNFQITQWAWAREPYKVVWAVRDDGKMLALTWVKAQEVMGWTRHDTNGIAVSVAVASEPPVNAVYWVVKRYIVGKAQWAYFVERMDNRLWGSVVEDAWCVDCALALPQPEPNATLTASAASASLGCISGAVVLGGNNYTAPIGNIVDLAGTGSGAMVSSVTVVAGAITAYTISPEGSGYGNPQVIFTDSTGSGAVAQVLLDTAVIFNASAPVFAAGNVASVLRMGGGSFTVTALTSPSQITAAMIAPITATISGDPNKTPLPAAPGDWTITAPVATVTGLNDLEGMQVTGLADGNVIPLQAVTGGTITLPQPASAIVVGLPFLPQAQSMHADIPGQMIQGKRKRIQGVTIRVANTRGIKIGQDQPIAAVQPNQAELPWNVAPNLMTEQLPYNNNVNAGVAAPLFTGDHYLSIAGDYSTTDGQPSPGMVAMQQDYPLPVELLAFIPELDVGDLPNA